MSKKPIVNNGSPTTITPVTDSGAAPPGPGDQLNTGDGGFPIDGQKYTMDTGAAGTGGPQGAYQKGVDVSAAYTDSNGQPQDIKPATLTTLAKYLSKVTMAQEGSAKVPNRYPVGSVQVYSSITDDKGYPAALEIQPVNPNSFAGGAESIIDYPTQQYPAISTLIKKGLSSATAVDGNDLLAGVTPTGTSIATDPTRLTGDAPLNPGPLPGHADTSAKIINPYTSAILKNNRFTGAAAAFAQVPDVSDPGTGYDPALTVQGKLGVWDPNAPTYSVGRLATIGPLLGLRATTTLGATSAGADPNSAGLEAAALLPGLAQLGATQIDQHALQAADILKSLTSDEPSSANILSTGTQSWGQLNDTNDPYSGADALGMLTLSIALTVGLTLIIDALDLLLGAITPQNKQPTHDANGKYGLGQYYANSKSGTAGKGGAGPLGAVSALASLNFGALLGINPTNFPFSMASQTGFNAFFQLPQGGGLGTQLLGSLTSSTDSPEFNIIVARTVIRSSITIINSFKKIGGNIMQAINAILAMIDTIRNSKIIAALNVWAMLGDAILSVPDQWTDASSTSNKKVSEIDAKPDALHTAVSQNRLQTSLKLAWASNRSRAQLLLPGSILANSLNNPGLGPAHDVSVGAKHDAYSLIDSYWSSATDNGRIPTALAQAFETQLAAEYVPFYFHDVRTNEMVGFHAFLASLNDDYSAAYEKTEGYGRVEPVRVYKSTERRIGMSFYIAATSELDFDDMWIKINKLVTLVYPQYTQGLQLSNGSSYTFTQPFSQLIGAAPLVRIRLGDLFHSNYSQFALARLFGLGNANFTINSQTDTAGTSLDSSKMKALPQAIIKALQQPQSETYYVSPGTYPYIDPPSTGGGLSPPIPPIPGTSAQGPKFATTFNPNVCAIPDAFIAKATKVSDSSTPTGNALPGGIICEIALNDDPDFMARNAQAISALNDFFGANQKQGMPGFLGGTYVIPPTALKMTDKTKDKLIASTLSLSPGAFNTALTTFMSPTGQSANAIAKSFADTGGQGLAGFIESMGFDWYDKVTWETHPGRTAPKFCKVTIAFSPVHDISPGIDHLGYNRAPIYPVGSYSNKSTSTPSS